MKHLILIAFLFLPALAAAQLYESNCYFPQFGKPGEIDTVYGGYPGQMLGSDVFNPGPIPGYPQGKIFIEGLPQNPPFLSAIDPKPPFNVHNFKIEKKLAFQRYGLTGDFAHLHNSKLWDFYAVDGNNENPRIYWSDENGNYDSTRSTYLMLPKRDRRYSTLDQFNHDLPCVGHFTSDTIYDLIFGGGYTTYAPPDTNAFYIALFNGGNKLYMQGDTAYSDSLYPINLPDTPVGNLIIGQFREKGRDDIIGITQFGGWFYYKNDPPFSLTNFWRSMLFDTLFTKRQNPQITGFFGGGGIVGSFFPKSIGDSSQDLYFYFNLTGSDGFVNHLYKGGKDFGSKRLFINTADFIFHTPRWYTTDLFGFGMSFYPDYAGDMTGKGYPVYRLWAALDQSRYEFYYVMGPAMNDHADMSFRPEPWGLGNIATLDANGDGKTDIIEGMPNFTMTKDLPANGYTQSIGLLALIYGSDQIPINVNSVSDSKFHESDLNIYPNPASRYITFNAPQAEELSIILYDLLGRAVFTAKRINVQGASKLKIDLPLLTSGSYILVISDEKKFYHSQLTIIN